MGGSGAISDARGAGTYGGCRFIGDVERVLIAKRDANSAECVVLVMSQRGGPSDLQLTAPPSWGVESAFTMPATAVTCLMRFPPSNAVLAAGGSGTVTFDPAKLSSISADVTLTFSAGDASGAATAALKANDVDTTGNCP